MGMKLLIEEAPSVETLTEEFNGEKHMFIEGIFMQAEVKNGNGRKYPKRVMEKEMNRYLKERVEAKRAWGELGHPATPSINHERVSHRIISLHMEGNDVMGKAIITKTTMGMIVEGLIRSGGVFGVSSRGLGSLIAKDGYQEVQEDFRLSTAADIVDNPSAPDATVRALIENTEWFVDEFGTWQPNRNKEEIIENTVNFAKKVPAARRDEVYIRLFDDFMTKMLAN